MGIYSKYLFPRLMNFILKDEDFSQLRMENLADALRGLPFTTSSYPEFTLLLEHNGVILSPF